MSKRIVSCRKLGKELPGLEKPPFPGELGDLIFQTVSAEAWAEWENDWMIKVVNEYRLNLAESGDHEKLIEQMKVFLGIAKDAELLEVENEKRGKEGIS